MQVHELHDYATVFVNGNLIGTLDRTNGIDTITIPKVGGKEVTLEILVAACGRNNYGDRMINDKKGITEYVSFESFTPMNWEMFSLPMDNKYLQKLSFKSGLSNTKEGTFFKGIFTLDKLGDTYLDMSKYKSGLVVVNGHNLGWYWNRGPQQRLYCPAPWLQKGENEIIVFDMEGVNAEQVSGYKTPQW